MTAAKCFPPAEVEQWHRRSMRHVDELLRGER